MLFFSASDKLIYTLPAPSGYDPAWYVKERWPGLYADPKLDAVRRIYEALFDPARIQIETRLLAMDDLEYWLYARQNVAEAAEEELSKSGDGQVMRSESAASNIVIESIGRRLHTARGGLYRLRDAGAAAGQRHEYRIIEVSAQGGRIAQGPFGVTVPAQDTGPAVSEAYEYQERPAAPRPGE